jgi:hypothetical protein
MKLPRKPKQWLREIDKATDDAYKQLEDSNRSKKEQVEIVLNVVMDRVARNRGIDRNKVAAKLGEVVESLATYLKSIPEEDRDWSGMIAFLYMEFHRVLGLINEREMLKNFISQQSYPLTFKDFVK